MNNEPQIRLQWPIENSVHHFQTWGEKKRKRRCFPHPGQVINSRVSSQQITSPLCDRPVILSASTDGLAAPWETTAGMWLKCRFWSKHRHSKLDSGVRNTYDEQKVQQNRTCDLFVHLENFCWDFNSVQRMFATEKKRDSKQLTQKLGRCQTTATSFFYAYCKCSCLSVQKETYARPFNVKKKKKNCCCLMRRTYESFDPEGQKAFCWHCFWNEWPLLWPVWFRWLVSPGPVPSVSPVNYLLLDTEAFVYISA